MAKEINSNKCFTRNNINTFDSFRRVHASSFRSNTSNRSPLASFKGISNYMIYLSPCIYIKYNCFQLFLIEYKSLSVPLKKNNHTKQLQRKLIYFQNSYETTYGQNTLITKINSHTFQIYSQ